MENITKELKHVFGDRLKENEPMSKHVNFRIGGVAKWFVEVQTIEELKHALVICSKNDLSYFVLGGGSNTLVSDEGLDGLVLKMAMRNIQVEGTTVVADAGVISASLARTTANEGLEGFAWAISLPGTIGGAVRGNAGCFGGETKDYLVKAEVMRDGEIVELSKEDLQMGYRDSTIKHSEDVVLRAWFEFPQGDSEALKQQLADTLEKRKSTQPLHAGSAGCVFKNYEIRDDAELKHLEDHGDIPEEMLKNRRISAGWLIDHVDLKGMKIGGAMISEEHGNFIVNLGEATASDIVQLIAIVKEKIRQKFGIQLHEEVKYIGF